MSRRELTQGSVVPDFCRIARLWSIWRDGKLKELRSGYKILLIIRTVRDTEPCFRHFGVPLTMYTMGSLPAVAVGSPGG